MFRVGLLCLSCTVVAYSADLNSSTKFRNTTKKLLSRESWTSEFSGTQSYLRHAGGPFSQTNLKRYHRAPSGKFSDVWRLLSVHGD